MKADVFADNLAASPAQPCILVIFGVLGDLTKRLLFPALCNLGGAGLLNENFHIIGIARENHSDESFREKLIKTTQDFIKNSSAKEYSLKLIKNINYLCGDFSDPTIYSKLKQQISSVISKGASKNCLFYFSTPPQFFEIIAAGLFNVALLTQENDSFKRILVEKPFGADLASARQLNKLLLSIVKEEQIFRIDHFLGKEMMRGILALRFSNKIFETIWHGAHIDHVQITAAETLGIETRGFYYDQVGALRDMVSNHLFQILSLVAMEKPARFSAEDIQQEKLKTLQTMQEFTPETIASQVIRGQYGAGKIKSIDVIDYRSEKNVSKESLRETFVALKVYLNHPHWQSVPFYLRTGKRMAMQKTEINIQFKPVKLSPFNNLTPNLLKISIQPNETISLHFNTKIPGPNLQLSPVKMEFDNTHSFNVKRQTGYEAILYDCMNGNRILFKSAQMVETEWVLIQPILEAWEKQPQVDFFHYVAGSEGPQEAQDLLIREGRRWLT